MFYQFVHYAVQQLLSSFSGSKIYAFLMCELNSLEVVCFSCQCVTADSSRNCEFHVCVCVCDILYTACAYREWFIFAGSIVVQICYSQILILLLSAVTF